MVVGVFDDCGWWWWLEGCAGSDGCHGPASQTAAAACGGWWGRKEGASKGGTCAALPKTLSVPLPMALVGKIFISSPARAGAFLKK